jgi:histidinol-phosphate/aromatic aminotransferase/cobyric acid decarboxylase-like protein
MSVATLPDAARDAHRYPDGLPLARMIAAQESVAEDHVVVTNGSDEPCYLLSTPTELPSNS